MKKTKIAKNATAYVFDEIPDYYTCVFVVEKEHRVFVIDTFCGSLSMEPVLADLAVSGVGKQVVVINTHFHWDHVWGNLAFRDNLIIAHELCYQDLSTHWQKQLDEKGQNIQGKVERVLPSLTFNQRLSFPDEGIEVFHTPGHTRDCVSIFDREEGALYVGDNVEKPIVYVDSPDVEGYIQTLEGYLALAPRKIFASHTLEVTPSDIHDTIAYLRNLKSGIAVEFETDYERRIHAGNQKNL